MNPDSAMNYVYCDDGGPEKVVRVYDSLDVIEPKEFDDPELRERRTAAERYAAAEARRIGCSWGCNYPN